MPMHEDEVRATPELVEGLVAEQCPQWHGLPVTALPDDVEGTDNVLFRLGDALVVRMPKVEWAAQQADSDARWLPRLAPHLPVSVPVPVHLGRPSDDYPWAWSVVPWVEGATPPRLGSDDAPLARDVADFALRLREVDPTGGPTKPAGSRGTPLSHVDAAARAGLERLRGHDDGLDLDAAERAWDICVSAPDFAAALWTFTGDARDLYRRTVCPDDATWLRACGWALAPSLTGIDYYRHTFPRMAEHGRQMVRAVVTELT